MRQCHRPGSFPVQRRRRKCGLEHKGEEESEEYNFLPGPICAISAVPCCRRAPAVFLERWVHMNNIKLHVESCLQVNVAEIRPKGGWRRGTLLNKLPLQVKQPTQLGKSASNKTTHSVKERKRVYAGSCTLQIWLTVVPPE